MSASGSETSTAHAVPEREALDRRTFLVTAASAALLPALLARAPAATAAVRDALEAQSCGDESSLESWHVDDMWGHRPRYGHAIPHGGHPGSPISWEHIDPIDLQVVGC